MNRNKVIQAIGIITVVILTLVLLFLSPAQPPNNKAYPTLINGYFAEPLSTPDPYNNSPYQEHLKTLGITESVSVSQYCSDQLTRLTNKYNKENPLIFEDMIEIYPGEGGYHIVAYQSEYVISVSTNITYVRHEQAIQVYGFIFSKVITDSLMVKNTVPFQVSEVYGNSDVPVNRMIDVFVLTGPDFKEKIMLGISGGNIFTGVTQEILPAVGECLPSFQTNPNPINNISPERLKKLLLGN